MAYSEKLAARIRLALAGLANVTEKKMFGGLAFMVDDKMCITVGPERIMCRIDPALHAEVVKKRGCQTVVMGGKSYQGYVHVSEENLHTQKALDYWMGLSLDYNKIAKRSEKK